MCQLLYRLEQEQTRRVPPIEPMNLEVIEIQQSYPMAVYSVSIAPTIYFQRRMTVIADIHQSSERVLDFQSHRR